MKAATINLFYQSLLTYKGLFAWFVPSSYVPQVLIRPALMVILFGLIGRYAINDDAATSLVIGRIAYTVVWIQCVGIVQSFYYERARGTASVVFSTPCNRFLNYVARGVFHYPNGPLVTVSALIGAWVMFGLDFAAINFGALTIAILALSLSSIGFSLFAGSIAFAIRNYQSLYFTMAGIVLVLTGSVIPVDELPMALQWVSKVLPLTHSLEAIRMYFEGQPFSDGAAALGRELLVGCFYVIVGYGLYRAVEVVTRRNGRLERSSV